MTAAGTRRGQVGDDPAEREDPAERGGDPVCWLPQVCQRCGAMAEADPPVSCPVCHAPIPAG
jgi:rubrerythrin